MLLYMRSRKNVIYSKCTECREEIEFQKMVYGVEIILHNVPKFLMMIALSSFFHTLPFTLYTWLPFALLRKYAGGLHAKQSITCSAITIVMFVFIPATMYNLQTTSNMNIIWLFVSILCLYKYAPADTSARPIIGKKKRCHLKKKSIICFCLISVIVVFTPIPNILPIIGTTYVLLSIHPITYRFFRQRMNNYMMYDKDD